MATEKKNILTKFYIIAFFMLVFFVSIVARVFNLQYVKGDEYRKLAKEKTVRQTTIYASKGNVYAADGSLLATSMQSFDVFFDVKLAVERGVFDANVKQLSKDLSELFGRSSNYYYQKLQKAKRRKNSYLPIAKNVGYVDYLKLKTFPIFKLGKYGGGFIAKSKKRRVHPIGKIAERTIGYKDYRGEAGVEGAFAEYLKGENGVRLEKRVAKNQWKSISNFNQKDPINGQDVVTTLDVNIQDITHHALLRQMEYFEADHGCAVVMETATGEIKAIANLGRTSKGKYFEKRNYAVWESHEPGSTFKLASLMAALDDKLIDTSTVVDTEKGRIYIHGSKVEDSHRGGYGKISAGRVFEVSSNVGIVKLIKKHYDHQPKKFIEKIASYGFTEPIGFQIKGEGKPYIPTPDDKKRWNKISLEWMSWGYGVSVTPMQILMFYNAVANNGVMVKPRFIKELRRQNKIEKKFDKEVVNSNIASEETLEKIKKVMENVVIKGTAENIYSPNFSMAGKTGTAKKFIPKHIDKEGNVVAAGYSNKHYTASFVGFFPVDKPKYTCIVVVHDPNKKKGYYGATVAAPVFKEIAQKIYTSTPVESEITPKDFDFAAVENNYKQYNAIINKENNRVPNVKGMSAMDAISLLENIGFKVKLSGVGKVKQQSIRKGEKIVKGKTIVLTLS
jgi:cell division protein FtsI (penicillin-binding protein 3)